MIRHGNPRPAGVILCAAGLLLGAIGALADDSLPPGPERARECLRSRLEAAVDPVDLVIDGQPLRCQNILLQFYQQRTFAPAWTDSLGALPVADSLVVAIEAADSQGLRPRDYHLAEITAALATQRLMLWKGQPVDTRGLVDLDLLLTDAYLLYGSNLLAGCLDPEVIDPEWRANRRQVDMVAVLESGLVGGRIEASLHALAPPQPGYARLRQALAAYRRLAAAGGWPLVPAGPKLEAGSVGGRVAALRARLRVTEDLPAGAVADKPPGVGSEAVFDRQLELAVRSFQERHGLDVDGVVGQQTLAALNVTVESRVRQIIVNLERWRWLPHDLGRRHILVNIADFRLDLCEDERTVLTMAVVVGKLYRRTPVFSADMTYLVFCPSWEIPPTITVEDKLPQIRKDPGSLLTDGIEVLQGWGASEKVIDPLSIDWSRLSRNYLPYHLRQEPGPSNPLGRVKFMFPNKFGVYLHDTPSRGLFTRSVRTFSSGCIRLENAKQLALRLLEGDADWPAEKILAAMESGQEQTVRLLRPIRVHLLYWTAWADERGTVQFRDDIYGRDRIVEEALGRRELSPVAGGGGEPGATAN